MRDRSLHVMVLGLLLAPAPAWVPAAPVAPGAPPSATDALVPLSESNPMDAAFREGVQRYESGEYAAALRAWREPAQAGHAGAQFSLGVAYATGNGAAEDLDRAVRWWEAAAEQGHAGAQFNLGLLYRYGRGVEQDVATARQWWRRAAEGGDAAAQFRLGALAATGQNEPVDYEKAVRWWRRAAAQGYKPAVKGLKILEEGGATPDE